MNLLAEVTRKRLLAAFPPDRSITAQELAKACFYSVRHVQEQLNVLEEKGLVQVRRTKEVGQPSLWQLAPPDQGPPPATIHCSRCGLDKPPEQFVPNKRRGGWYAGCRNCRNGYRANRDLYATSRSAA